MIIKDVLTREDEIALVVKCQAGDQQAWERIIEVHQTYIDATTYLYWRYDNGYYEWDDYAAEAMYGFWTGVMRFEIHRKGVRLATYATWWIKQRLRQMRRNRTVVAIPLPTSKNKSGDETPVAISLDSEMLYDGLTGQRTWATVLEDHRFDREKCPEVMADRDIVHKLLEGLTPSYRTVAMLKASGFTFEKIAEKLGVTRQRVFQIWPIALKKLQEGMRKMIANGDYEAPPERRSRQRPRIRSRRPE